MSIIHGKREYQRREVASLTKIMTCYVVIKLCKYFHLDPKTTEVTISDVAADIRGTTANLQTNDMLSIEQLLYGLMLPSGNDAAFALSQFFGNLLYHKKYTRSESNKIRSF
jgi:serine-type D-Ala-D-Ala carboxypeptidase (penicillin-binding protein 5/6)